MQRDYPAYAKTPAGKAARARAHARYVAKRREMNQRPTFNLAPLAQALQLWNRT